LKMRCMLARQRTVQRQRRQVKAPSGGVAAGSQGGAVQRSSRWSRAGLAATSALVALHVGHGAPSRSAAAYAAWRDYGGSDDAMQNSPLTQVHRGNGAEWQTGGLL